MYLNTRIFPTTGYARVLLFMFIRRELGGKGTGCLFQFTYCVSATTNGFDPWISGLCYLLTCNNFYLKVNEIIIMDPARFYCVILLYKKRYSYMYTCTQGFWGTMEQGHLYQGNKEQMPN